MTFTWSNTSLSYITIAYYGNAIVGTGTTYSSGQQTGTSWTTGDLSFNALYNFTMTPYNATGQPGEAKNFTVNTTPAITGAYSSGTSTTSSAQLQWYGTYYYVRIYRKVTSPYTTDYIEVSANTKIYNMPFNDTDLSGNTTYVYYVQPYDAIDTAYAASNTVSITTNARVATDLSAVFYDGSSIQLSFTLPKNSYSSSYYYVLRASSSGINRDICGTTSPLWINGLTGGTTYTCYILSYLDNVLGSTSSGYSVTTSAAKGISTTGIVDSSSVGGYTIYGFKSTSTTSTITINGYAGYTAYIFAVGGGGGASADNQTCAGGGGGGGVVSTSITLPTSLTITCSVAAGGAAGTTQTNGSLYNGGNTVVSFSSSSYNNITAYGGGGGAGYGRVPGGGACGGGQSRDANASSYGYAYIVDSTYTITGTATGGSAGSQGYSTYSISTGCAGAGSGATATTKTGGTGTKPSSVFGGYASYYFGGGGGGGSTAGNGGLGGGGGSGTTGTTTGGAGYNKGGDGSSAGGGGSGGANTGGGGGGGFVSASSRYGGAGGSGIVLIAIAI
jgi:hypothetical protein